VVPRWYCRKAGHTVSLLPTFAAAGLPGTLDSIEQGVVAFERERQAGATVAQAAQWTRPDIEAQGALRWVRRRVQWVGAALALLVGCAPELVTRCELAVTALRDVLHTQHVLVRVREIAAVQLQHAPRPVGLAPAGSATRPRQAPHQHTPGPDPPP
jgi:hypothetical protein